eukprot:365758-Chlamydomonas_euryale.AAC.16
MVRAHSRVEPLPTSCPSSRLTSFSSSASDSRFVRGLGCASCVMMTGCWLRIRFSMSRSTMTMPSMRISWLFTVRCSRSICRRIAGSWLSDSFRCCACIWIMLTGSEPAGMPMSCMPAALLAWGKRSADPTCRPPRPPSAPPPPPPAPPMPPMPPMPPAGP